MFENRADAGRKLAEAVAQLRLPRTAVVVGIPLGGFAVALETARALDLPLEALICRKLRASCDHSLAAGALTETGHCFVNPDLPGRERLDERHRLDQVLWTQRRIAAEQKALREGRPFPRISGRPVVVIDDGVCTGSTMIAACRALRAQAPALLVAAVPAGPAQALRSLENEADEVLFLEAPEDFGTIASHYRDWRPVPEKLVARALRRRLPPAAAL